jgi:hypothetical protein
MNQNISKCSTGDGVDHLAETTILESPIARMVPVSEADASFLERNYPARDSDADNKVLGAVMFRPTLSGPQRSKWENGKLQHTIDEICDILDGTSFMEKPGKEIEDDTRCVVPGVRFREALNKLAKVIQYRDDRWRREGPERDKQFDAIRKAASLIDSMPDASNDQIFADWDYKSRLCVYRIRLWLRSGTSDKADVYQEYYQDAEPVQIMGGPISIISCLKKYRKEFRCNVCLESFDRATRLQNHLVYHDGENKHDSELDATRQIHEQSAGRMRQRDGLDSRKIAGKPLGMTVTEKSIQMQLRDKESAKNGGDTTESARPMKKATEEFILGDSWFDISRLTDSAHSANTEEYQSRTPL